MKINPYIKLIIRAVMISCFLIAMSRTGHGVRTLEYWLVFTGVLLAQILNENKN